MRGDRVLIAGAGPVGLVAAASLVAQGIPVTVLEAGEALSTQSRASTFHPSTLDMLDQIGVVGQLIEGGLKAPHLQFRSKDEGVVAQFNFADISDLTRHPFRLQSEQFKLTRIIYNMLQDNPNFRVCFSQRVKAVSQHDGGVSVVTEHKGAERTHTGPWLIGADGASSQVRSALGIEFEGFTWPERFLVLSTPFDFHQVIPDLVSVNYVADPVRWHFLLRIPDLWRVMFPVAADVADEVATTSEYAQSLLANVVPGLGNYEIAHSTLYRVHQRVAKTYRKGRVFLAGDAAHINNPLGGMGMNGGIHDALNLSGRLGQVWRGAAPEQELDRYDLQRRQVTVEHIQSQTIQNKKDMEAQSGEQRAAFRERMQRIAESPALTREYLTQVSMIKSLRRAEEIA